MPGEVLGIGVLIALQSLVYLTSLAWLAWQTERRTGQDGFHLVVVLAVGCLILHESVKGDGVGLAWGLAISLCVAAILQEGWFLYQSRVASSQSLIEVIVFASVAIIGFDFLTSHQTVSLPVGNQPLVTAAMILGCIGGIALALTSSGRWLTALRLGSRNQWAMLYWARPVPQAWALVGTANLIALFVALVIPTGTIGVSSRGILRDVAVALLITRIASTRGIGVLVGAAGTFAVLRTLTGYLIVDIIAPAVMETLIVVVLLVWLRYRGSRTAWRDADVH